MKKTRSDAKWNGLSQAQQQKLEAWLFEDNLSYEDALARAKKELGFTGSIGSVQRFYKRREHERFLSELMESGGEALEIGRAPVRAGTLRSSALKIMAQQFFQQMRREGQREGLELRRQRLEFQKTQWQYEIIREVTNKVLPDLEKIEQECAEANDPYAENKRLNRIRTRLFGANLPEMHPESAEEEAAMAAAKAREEAESERRHAELMAESRREVEQRRQEEQPSPEPEPLQDSRPALPEPPKPKWEDSESGNLFPYGDHRKIEEFLKRKR